MEKLLCYNLRKSSSQHHQQSGCRSSTCYGSGDDVSWRWWGATLLAATLIASCGAQSAATDVRPLSVPGVCQSLDIRNSVDMFSQLEGCRIIEGVLQIVLIDHAEPSEYDNLTFPELTEVTGFVLMYRVSGLRSLSRLFPNLAVIRGNELFFDYSLIVFEMLHLKELGLSSLTDIVRGGVYFVRNPMLCNIDSIDWDLIARHSTTGPDAKKHEIHFIQENRRKNECPVCPKDCPQVEGSPDNLCWNGQQCQRVCPAKCGNRSCNADGECCHEYCLGGCHGNESTDCISCRGVMFGDRCTANCPEGTFMYLKMRCITEEECHKMPPPRQNSDSEQDGPLSWKPFQRECILTCPSGFREVDIGNNRYTCEQCIGPCKKECLGSSIDSIASAQKLRGCTSIKKFLEIQIRGGSNVVKELEENLNMIEEIEGYLKIVRSFPLMSLNFLKNLKVIHGNNYLESNKYALVVLDNQNLMELWDWKTKKTGLEIGKGRLFFHFNPKLCISKIDELRNITNLPMYTDMEVAQNSNGDKVACDIQELKADVYVRMPRGAIMRWSPFLHYDSRTLLGYIVYIIEAPYQNVTMYDGRDACGGDGWKVDDRAAPDTPENLDLVHILTQLKPYTQYAYYVKTNTIASEKLGAQSKIQYFRTLPDTPTAPRLLKAYSNSSSELVIHWSPPSVPNGNVTHYVVRGVWEPEDQKYLEQRNYCSEPLTLPDVKHVTPDPKIVDDIDDSSDAASNKEEACPCKKDEKEEKAKVQKEKEAQFQIKFEDALHNIVYKRRIDQAEPWENDTLDNRNQRVKREILSAFENRGNGVLSSVKSGSTGQSEAKHKALPGEHEMFEHTVWKSQTLVVRNLHHFAYYTISVKACREVEPEEGPNVKNNCSAESIISTRTLHLKTADNVKVPDVQVMGLSNHTGDVLLKWDEPPSPNGLIVTYQIEYRRIDIENHKPFVECVTRREFHNMSQSYILKNLFPGNYSLRIRATSLAGNGDFTESVTFYIKERQTLTMIQMVFMVLASIVILVFVILGALIYYKKQTGIQMVDARLIASVNPEYVSTMYVVDQWEVPRAQVELVRELGQGSFGMVWEGVARDIVPNHPVMPCAIKTVNEKASDRERIEFLNEASVMKGFNTHHVVKLMGVVSQGQPTLVVMELMANGDLKSYLRSHRPDVTEEPRRQPPTLRRILQMAVEIADGMAYLAAKKFVHRDLAARNCMVAEDLTVKIGDFGMTRDIYETDYYRKGTKGLLPVRWMAPESLKDGVFTSLSDVWSYGVVLWEMATLASQPYQGLANEQVLRYVIGGGVMEEPDDCPKKLYDLMRSCWEFKPGLRPSFLDLVAKLLPDVKDGFASVSFYHSEEGQDLRCAGGNETTPLSITRDIEDFSLGSDDEDGYKQPQPSSSSKLSNGNTTPNGYIVARSNGVATTTC